MTESQILLLNNLIYRTEFSDPTNYGLTIGEIFEKGVKNSKQQAMTSEEWDEIYKMVKSDADIMNLRLYSAERETETGAKMACFVDPNEQAYAVFAGTGGNEWRDDCVAGCETDSQQQIKALKWFESLPYNNISVSGHSKGGNKAMYVAICSDNVGECYAFDGEGFSNEFIQKYTENGQIQKNASKIHLRANSRDYVNILLNYIPNIDIKFINNDEGVSSAKEYHSPNALFKYENGKIVYSIGDLTDNQDPLMEMFHDFTVYLLNNASEDEKILALSVIGELLTQFLGGEIGVVRDDIIEMFGVEAIEIVLRYLTKYLQTLQITDPLTYYKYRNAFVNFSEDAIGFGFWQFMLNCLVNTPFTISIIFDSLTNGTILHVYRLAEGIVGGNVRGRDFSQSTKEKMISAAKETEEEAWWRVDRWDCWYRIEKAFGGLQWDSYTGKIDEYYRKLIDINDSSVKEIERIFEKVYAIDNNYSHKVRSQTSELESRVEVVLGRMSQSIVVGN